MKIHLITNLFHPDELAGASLYTDMARFFLARGHDVRVTCTFPYYPAWKLQPNDEGVKLREEEFEGIPIRRVSMYVPSEASGLKRMMSDASFLWSLIRRAKFADWTPDVVLSACPMLSQCVAQRFLYQGKNVPRLLIVQDFVVDAALELNILNAPGLGWGLRTMERWALRSATTVSTISPEMLNKLRDCIGKADRKMIFIPNWIHQSLEDEICRQWPNKPPRKQSQLMYSGNVGVKQGLPDFVDKFAGLSTNWRLRIQGGGAERDRLVKRTEQLDNVMMADVSGEDSYVRSLLETSACLITQKPGVSAKFLPSKLLPALATGTPVLAVCEADSPLGREVASGGYGAVIHPDDTDGLASILNAWQCDASLLQAFELAAKERSDYFSRDRILSIYEQEFVAMTGVSLPKPAELASSSAAA